MNEEMMPDANFVTLVKDALHHLYDMAVLRTHLLGFILDDGYRLSPKERAWQLHHLLRETIGELAPTEHTPSQSREWRRYHLLNLRYIEALPPQQVADRMCISRRQYFREQGVAIEMVAELLHSHRTNPEPLTVPETMLPLVYELERAARHETSTDLVEVMTSVIQTLDRAIEARQFTIHMHTPDQAIVSVQRSLLRQFLLGLMGHLLAQPPGQSIDIRIIPHEQSIEFHIDAPDVNSAVHLHQETWFNEFALLIAGTHSHIDTGSARQNFALTIVFSSFVKPAPSVLIIDDNADMLALYERFLDQEGYAVTYTQDISEALSFVKTHRPHAVILDLMLPEHDGWELLTRLKHDPDTSNCPVIICSVLKQHDLAWMLGAAHFLAKPITKTDLLEALRLVAQAS